MISKYCHNLHLSKTQLNFKNRTEYRVSTELFKKCTEGTVLNTIPSSAIYKESELIITKCETNVQYEMIASALVNQSLSRFPLNMKFHQLSYLQFIKKVLICNIEFSQCPHSSFLGTEVHSPPSVYHVIKRTLQADDRQQIIGQEAIKDQHERSLETIPSLPETSRKK